MLHSWDHEDAHNLIASGNQKLEPADGSVELPEESCSADLVYRHIRAELNQDGKPPLNLASFVTTWMDSQAQQLALEEINKNLVNQVEYAQTNLIHQRVVAMTAKLFHAEITSQGAVPASVDQPNPSSSNFIGTTTAGSSEAIMLALLAHKWNWRRRHEENLNRSAKDQPYLIIGTHTHACFAKFARYFEVKVKWVPLEIGQYSITAQQVKAILATNIKDDPQIMADCGYTPDEVEGRMVSELVMAIGCVVCNTFTGDADDVAGIDQVLTEGGWDIPIHVDAASGGFILPFTQTEDDPYPIQWDFRLPHVQSINVSNHKFGLVYPGLGTLIFRNTRVVPDDLFFDIDYLSGTSRNYSLNFSRSSVGVLMQYYNFLRLGKAGYRRIIKQCLASAQFLTREIQTSPKLNPYLEVISNPKCFPVVALKFRQAAADEIPFTLADLAHTLKQKGWLVPTYHLPANVNQVEMMRLVVKENMTPDLGSIFIEDLTEALDQLLNQAHLAETTSIIQDKNDFVKAFIETVIKTESDTALTLSRRPII